ncbi:PilC/PilY family type IV pilus protein, partial [Thermodesulfobacteriota bacterium]
TSAVDPPGVYNTTIFINDVDGYNPTATVPVEMTINPVITVNAGANGSITPAGPIVEVPYGTDQIFTIEPDTANDYYVITDVVVDTISVLIPKPISDSTTYTFPSVTANGHTISATFDDHGTGTCYDPTADDIDNYLYSGYDYSTEIDLGTDNPAVVTGTITPTGEWDFFKIIVPSGGGAVTIHTEGATDTHGTLLNTNCSIIAVHDDINGTVNPNFFIQQDLDAGEYYLLVREAFGTSTGSYTLYVELTPDDHADTCAVDATAITCGSTVSGELIPGGDRDFFRFTIDDDKLVTAYTTSTIDTYGVIYDDTCDEITNNNNASDIEDDFRIEWQLPGPAEGDTERVYYMSVRHLNSTETGTFNLTLECAQAQSISAYANFGGTMTPQGLVIVPNGSNKSFDISANFGNTISDVLINDVPVNDIMSLTIAHPSYYVKEAALNGAFTYAALVNDVDTFYTFQFNNITTDWSIRAEYNVPPEQCVDIADYPLDVRLNAAPANIMVLFDDSSSMDWEIMTIEAGGTGVSAGQMTIGNKAYHYLYNMEDRVIKTGQGSNVLIDNEDRLHWKSQWQGHNKVYYNAAMDYTPWPNKTDVDPDTPPSRPDEPSVIANMNEIYALYGDDSGIIYRDDGDNKGFDISNNFDVATDGTAYEDEYYWTPDPPDDNPDDYEAIFEALTHDAGEYEVYVRYVTAIGRSDSVPYVITYGDGTQTDTKYVNQTKNGGSWISLGTYNFDEDIGSVSVTLTGYNIADGTVSIDAVKFQPTDIDIIEIPIAHYYTCTGDAEIVWESDNDGNYPNGNICTGDAWLVTFTGGSMRYFKVNDDDSDNAVDNGELTEYAEVDVPAEVITGRTYAEERQNFANWFTYYRKRTLLARAALSQAITTFKNVNVGIRTLEGEVTIPVQPIKVAGLDYTNYLLNSIYDFDLYVQGAATSSSPVRTALEEVGKYFDLTDGGDDGNIGPSPISVDEEGGSCQQNFVILFSDAYYNGQAAGSLPLEDDDVGEYSGYAPYISKVTNTVADLAMNFYARDLAPEVANEVPPNPFDDATHQHLVLYTVAFGAIGTLNPDDYDVEACKDEYYKDYTYEPTGDEDDPGKDICPPWPSMNTDTKKIDDLWHAAVNGRGEFHSAANILELMQAFTAVLQNIEARVGSAASVSVNGDELYSELGADIRMYQSSYFTRGWSGDVKAYELNLDTGEVITASPLFSSQDELNTMVRFNNQARIIATYDDDTDPDNPTGIPFSADSLSADQQTLILSGFESSTATVAEMVDYLRGKDDNELENGGIFRDRQHVLGDIVHSSPFFHNEILYTGANDGMLHAFSAVTGEELFAYIPDLVFDKLSQLAKPNYSHLYYVDRSPVIEAVKYDDGGTAVTKDILIGGLGKGGKGFYALDISGINGAGVVTSDNDLADRVLWEYPRATTPQSEIDDMGYSYSKPAIVRTYSTTVPWVMIFGNGYNSLNSHAVLFVMNPVTGELIKKIDTGLVVASGNQCNGLSTPVAIDYNFDARVDYVYAGDLYGNIWKFDFSSTDYNDWGVAFGDNNDGTNDTTNIVLSYDENATTPDDPASLFQARGPLDIPQPITSKPDVLAHCDLHGYMVVFGTGKYLGESDFDNLDIQSMYGVWDFGDDEDNDEYLGILQRNSSQKLSNWPDVSLLQQIWLPGDFVSSTGQTLRILSNYDINYQTITDPDGDTWLDDPGLASTCTNGVDDDTDGLIDVADPDECPAVHAGWYVNVPAGERIANDILIRQGKVVLVGFSPESTPCGAGGTSVVMEIDACSGGRLDEPQLDINDDKVVDVNDLIDIGGGEYVVPTGMEYEGRLMPPAILRKKDEEIKYFSTNTGSIITLTESAVTLGLTYWREFE